MKNYSTLILLHTKKILGITRILTLEHLREPTSVMWSAIAPCILFLLTQNHTEAELAQIDFYIARASWFLSYISANVAFFGFSFYLIGRRESGFTRSFIYQRGAIARFLAAHFLSYSTVSLIYAGVFYLATKLPYGDYQALELIYLSACFYTSFLIFSCIGLVVASLPIKFDTASTLFSLLSFLMLLSGYVGNTQANSTPHSVLSFNPLLLSSKIFTHEAPLLACFLIALSGLLTGLYLTGRNFRIQPVWSRY